MADQLDAIAWARVEAQRLEHSTVSSNGELASARQLLAEQAPGSAFVDAVSIEALRGATWEETGPMVAGVLNRWCDYIESGMGDLQPYAQRYRFDAATDLMEQVQELLGDRAVHPAVPVMLAGAALEQFLRGQHAATDEAIVGHPSIAKYGVALRKAEMI